MSQNVEFRVIFRETIYRFLLKIGAVCGTRGGCYFPIFVGSLVLRNCSYDYVYGDMLGFARLARASLIVDAMVACPPNRLTAKGWKIEVKRYTDVHTCSIYICIKLYTNIYVYIHCIQYTVYTI